MKARVRSITIIVRDGQDFDVHEDERYTTRLCWGEMLEQIVGLTRAELGPRYPFLDAGQHQAEHDRGEERHARSRAEQFAHAVSRQSAIERALRRLRAAETDTRTEWTAALAEVRAAIAAAEGRT